MGALKSGKAEREGDGGAARSDASDGCAITNVDVKTKFRRGGLLIRKQRAIRM